MFTYTENDTKPDTRIKNEFMIQNTPQIQETISTNPKCSVFSIFEHVKTYIYYISNFHNLYYISYIFYILYIWFIL